MEEVVLNKWLTNLESLDADSLLRIQELLDVYPYCQSLWLLYLKNLYLLQDDRLEEALHQSAAYITDRKMAYALLYGLDSYHKNPVIAEEAQAADRTSELIDAFLGGEPQEKDLELAMDYPSDYTEYLLREEGEQSSENDSHSLNGIGLIDDFLEESKQGTSAVQVRPEEKPIETYVTPDAAEDPAEDDSYFTETLAKIYIKQQRYSKALEIIKKLSLKYPKKNIYFADQIRFLEKVIINAKSK